MPRVSGQEENPFEAVVDAWRVSLDASLTAAAKSLEASLTSKEFLTLSRHGLELLCGHRDRISAISGELLGIPARPTTPRNTKKKHGRRKR